MEVLTILAYGAIPFIVFGMLVALALGLLLYGEDFDDDI